MNDKGPQKRVVVVGCIHEVADALKDPFTRAVLVDVRRDLHPLRQVIETVATKAPKLSVTVTSTPGNSRKKGQKEWARICNPSYADLGTPLDDLDPLSRKIADDLKSAFNNLGSFKTETRLEYPITDTKDQITRGPFHIDNRRKIRSLLGLYGERTLIAPQIDDEKIANKLLKAGDTSFFEVVPEGHLITFRGQDHELPSLVHSRAITTEPRGLIVFDHE